MATLKITLENSNHIWLPDIRQVEEMCFFNSHINAVQSEEYTPWQWMQSELSFLKERNPALHAIIEERLLAHKNYSPLLHKTDKQMLLLHVIMSAGEDVERQNWLVLAGNNYLLENGKTIDRL